jgi:phosphotransferase system HPr (HPr) family protein
MLAQTAMQFKSRIAITFNDRVINGKSLVHVVSLGAKKGDKLGFSVHGDDEEKALAALVDLIKVRNFDGE